MKYKKKYNHICIRCGHNWNNCILCPKFCPACKKRWNVSPTEYYKPKTFKAGQNYTMVVHYEQRQIIRMRLIKILGGDKCCKCGFDNILALQIDHINGGGSQQLKRQFKSLEIMYKYYIRYHDLAIEELQVLCANCNRLKMHENNEFGDKFTNINEFKLFI